MDEQRTTSYTIDTSISCSQERIRHATIKLRRGDYKKSLEKNPILDDGEIMVLCNIDGLKIDHQKYRNGAFVIGDGIHPLKELPLLIRDNYTEFKVLQESHYLLVDRVEDIRYELFKYEREVKDELKKRDDKLKSYKVYIIILILYAIISGFVIGDTKQQVYDLQNKVPPYEYTIEESE